MGYKKEIYEKALEQKLAEVKRLKTEYERSLAELRRQNPELDQIEIGLMRAGSGIALAAISGDNAKFENLKDYCIKNNARKKEILDAAGIKKPEISCKTCEDSGFHGGKFCKCVTDIARRLAFKEMSVSLPVGDCKFENFDLKYYADTTDGDGANPRKRATSTLQLCKDFAENFPGNGRSLLFMGEPGLGKTHLSLSIVAKVSERGFGVVYGSAQNLFSAAEKEHFSYTGDTTAMDSLLNCDLLVIDDLGTEFYSPFTASLFYNVINTRIQSGKPLIISTNLSFDELEKRYTPRITSRFIGSFDMKKFIGQDIRQQKLLETI